MTFAEQIVYAMFKPSKYRELIDLKKSRFTVFVIVLMLAVGLVRQVIPEAAFITGFGGFEKLFTEKMAPLNFNDGSLVIESPFTMSMPVYKIMIDTDADKVSEDKMDKSGGYIAFGRKYLSIVVNDGSRLLSYGDALLSELLPDGFSNETLRSMIPFIYFSLVISYLVYSAGCFLKYAVLALLFGLSISGINRMANIGLDKKEIFRLCFYGQTLGILISNFNSALGLLPSLFVSIICIMISVHMINLGLRNIGGMSKVDQL
ncbi:MAG: DUF1189 family protein [Lachnospiraceae bacterium]|nr:DUF1189 family protein [Lachnospiraceae bacterium]